MTTAADEVAKGASMCRVIRHSESASCLPDIFHFVDDRIDCTKFSSDKAMDHRPLNAHTLAPRAAKDDMTRRVALSISLQLGSDLISKFLKD